MSENVDDELFAITQHAHQHFVDLAEEMRVLPTPTIEQSIHKRLLLYFAALLNDGIGATSLLASHDGLRITMLTLRASYEYVIRAKYYAQRRSLTRRHITELWTKIDRLYSGGVRLSFPETRKQIDDAVADFFAKNPEWERPHEATLKPLLEEMYGRARADRLYDRWHRFYSVFVHGYFDGVPMVLGHDGHNTIVKPGALIANTALAEATRFGFSMAALLKREFGIQNTQTLPLFRRYVRRRKTLGILVQSPFPVPTLSFRAKA
jgi:hypothetical protein